LLTPDLVIAARDRAREPELAEATAARALSTPISPRLARYDVIVVSESADDAERDARIAAEFARHDHRVFHYGEHAGGPRKSAAPNLHRLPLPGTKPGTPPDLLDALRKVRRSVGIEAAALFAPATIDPALIHEVRGWGWRAAGPIDGPNALDVRVAFDVDDGGAADAGIVRLPRDLSWPARWAALDRALRAAWPRASIIMLTHDNLAFSRMCLASVLENTEYPNYELLAIDNASSDGTVAELQRLARDVPRVRAIFNEFNAGFGPGNNQGLAAADGDVLVLLNNDTIVPRGWLTNRTCNEAQLDIPYQTYAEFQAVARAQGERHEGERYPIRMPMMFCTAFRRDAYERIGPLDERYEVGMFEDEDYALRAKAAGYEVAWTPEVYVHHAYHASIGKLLPSGEYMRLVRLNQGRFEEKWGICWERHRPIPAQAQSA
jgi:GT2 family glycosyltransferase